MPLKLLCPIAMAFALTTGCTSSAEEVAQTTTSEATTTTEEVASTTTSEATTTTVDERAQAEAEIEAVMIAWYEAPYDTSLGLEGVSLEFQTGRSLERSIAQIEADAAAGEFFRSRGGDRLEVDVIRSLDLEAGTAVADVCTLGDGELIDAATGEVLGADDGDSWEGEVFLERVDGVWLVENFFTDEANGGSECELSE